MSTRVVKHANITIEFIIETTFNADAVNLTPKSSSTLARAHLNIANTPDGPSIYMDDVPGLPAEAALCLSAVLAAATRAFKNGGAA